MSDIGRKTRGSAPQSIPTFATEEGARAFWETHDSTEFWDQMEDVTATPPAQLGIGPGRAASKARKRPAEGRMDLVSLRFPAEMIEAVKAIATERHIPYQTLMRAWIGERVSQERKGDAETQGEKVV